MIPPIFDPDMLEMPKEQTKYRIEYGDTPDRCLQNRLDRMVAAVYPTIWAVERMVCSHSRDENQLLGDAVQPAVSLAWRLLKAVDESIAREAEQPRVQTIAAEQQPRDQKLDALVAKMRVP